MSVSIEAGYPAIDEIAAFIEEWGVNPIPQTWWREAWVLLPQARNTQIAESIDEATQALWVKRMAGAPLE